MNPRINTGWRKPQRLFLWNINEKWSPHGGVAALAEPALGLTKGQARGLLLIVVDDDVVDVNQHSRWGI